MKKALLTGITGQDGSYCLNFSSRKATRSTGSSDARALSTQGVSTPSTRIPMCPSVVCTWSMAISTMPAR